MRRARIELFSQIFVYQRVEVRVAIRAGRELLQIFGEGPHMLVVLLGIKSERVLRKLALRPSLIEGMLQQVMLFDQRVKRFDQSLRLWSVLRHSVLRFIFE